MSKKFTFFRHFFKEFSFLRMIWNVCKKKINKIGAKKSFVPVWWILFVHTFQKIPRNFFCRKNKFGKKRLNNFFVLGGLRQNIKLKMKILLNEKIGKLFFHTFLNIAHLLGQKVNLAIFGEGGSAYPSLEHFPSLLYQ